MEIKWLGQNTVCPTACYDKNDIASLSIGKCVQVLLYHSNTTSTNCLFTSYRRGEQHTGKQCEAMSPHKSSSLVSGRFLQKSYGRLPLSHPYCKHQKCDPRDDAPFSRLHSTPGLTQRPRSSHVMRIGIHSTHNQLVDHSGML